jgi:4-carboxymuconolactone decarboxylase
MSRLPPIKNDQLSETQMKVAKAIQDGPRGNIPMTGPFGVWLRANTIGDAIQNLGASLRYETILEENIKELAICIVGHHYKAKFEFAYHEILAIQSGVPEEVLNDLKNNKIPSFTEERLELVFLISKQLLATHSVADDLYQRGFDEFDEQGMIELVSLIGYYCLVALTLNTFEIPLDEGMQDPFPNVI